MQHKALLLASILAAGTAVAAGDTPVFEASIGNLMVKQAPGTDGDRSTIHAFLERRDTTLVATGQVDGGGAGTLGLYRAPQNLADGMSRWGHMDVVVEGCTLYASVYRMPATLERPVGTNGQGTGTASGDKETIDGQGGGTGTDGQQTDTGDDRAAPAARCAPDTEGGQDGTGRATADCVRTVSGSSQLGTSGQGSGTGQEEKSSTARVGRFVGAAAFKGAMCPDGS